MSWRCRGRANDEAKKKIITAKEMREIAEERRPDIEKAEDDRQFDEVMYYIQLAASRGRNTTFVLFKINTRVEKTLKELGYIVVVDALSRTIVAW